MYGLVISVVSLLCANNVVLLVSSERDLQHALLQNSELPFVVQSEWLFQVS